MASTFKTIKHICGHTTTVESDRSTNAWIKHYEQEQCFKCAPVVRVERICGHTEAVTRGFFSPRAMEQAAMCECSTCRPAALEL
jgi:hypothetical protein